MAQQLIPLPAEVVVVSASQWNRRRGGQRYQCGPATLAQIVLLQADQTHQGWILDLSTSGAGILLTKPLDAGTLFVVHLKSSDRQRRYELHGRVAHATTQHSGDWLIGCEFKDPLTAEDLEALL